MDHLPISCRFKGSSDPPQNRRIKMLKEERYGLTSQIRRAEIERMLKALIKSLENKPWNPWTLFSN